MDQLRRLLQHTYQWLQLWRVHHAIRRLHLHYPDRCALHGLSLFISLTHKIGLAPYFRYTQLPSGSFTLDYACDASDCALCNGTWTNTSTACRVRSTRRMIPHTVLTVSLRTFKAVGGTYLTTYVINKQATIRYSLYLGTSNGPNNYNCYTSDGLNTSVPVTDARVSDFAADRLTLRIPRLGSVRHMHLSAPPESTR